MKLLLASMICSLFAISSLTAAPAGCKCQNCTCTIENHCGCFSEAGCQCDQNSAECPIKGPRGCPNGCGCGKHK